MLKNTINKHIPEDKQEACIEFFTPVENLPYEDIIAQYDNIDDYFELTLWFKEDLNLSLSKDPEETDDGVTFTLFHDKELLVADHMSLKELVQKMHNILNKC